MADNFTTPVAAGTTFASKDLGGGVQLPKNAITDQAGNDAIGLAVASPAQYTLLGWLKALVTALAGRLLTDSGTANTAYAITPSDTAAINPVPRGGVRVNVGGTIVYRAAGSTADVTMTAGDKEYIPVKIQYIRATGTTATGILGLGD